MSARKSSDDRLDVGIRARHFRSVQGLTQEEVARAAKLTPKFLSQIENGRVNPSIGVLARVVNDGLRVPLAVFFAWDPVDGHTSAMVALLASQPSEVRGRLVRAMHVLCDRDLPVPARHPPGEPQRARSRRDRRARTARSR